MELTIVITIIGILAAISIPAYNQYVMRARVAEALVLAMTATRAVTESYGRWGQLPAGNSAAGLPPPTSIAGKYVEQVLVSDGVVQVKLANKPFNHTGSDWWILLEPIISPGTPAGAIAWNCVPRSPPTATIANGASSAGNADGPPDNFMPTLCKRKK